MSHPQHPVDSPEHQPAQSPEEALATACVAEADALAALCAPTVNSYKRLASSASASAPSASV